MRSISASSGSSSGWGGTSRDLAGSPSSLIRPSKPAAEKTNKSLAGPESTVKAWGTSLERNPLPDPSRWAEIPGSEERLRRALNEVYAYYQGNEAMLTNVVRDMPFDPVLQENNVFLFRHWETMRDTIADAFEASGERREALLAAVALALELQTWRTLVDQQGFDDDRAVELMAGMVHCLMRS